jgi:TPR repeat protein
MARLVPWLVLLAVVGGAAAQDTASSVVAGIEAYNSGDAGTAFRLLKAAADAGDSDAQVNLGYMYARGHGVAQDQQESMRLYLSSARQGNAEGMNAVGFKYMVGSGIKPDIGQAVHWFCRAAVSGDARGLNNLGILHFEGKGVPRDVEEFRSLWRQAADRSNPNAMFNLARSLLFGPDEPRDQAEGMRLMVDAARLGHGGAQQVVRRAGYAGPLPKAVNTELAMRIASRNTPPGKARYCGFLVSSRIRPVSAVVEAGERRDRVGADLAEQRGEVIVEAFGKHQPVLEGQHDDEGLDERPAGRLDPEEAADVPTVPGRLGHVAAVLQPAAALARAALHRDVERGPPLPVVGRRALVAVPDLAGREILETARGMQRGERAGQVLAVLGREMAAHEGSELLVHGRSPAIFEL